MYPLLTFVCGALIQSLDEPAIRDVLRLDPGEALLELCEPQRARAALGLAASAWAAQQDCVSCHTNGTFLIAGAWGPLQPDHTEARAFARQYLGDYVERGQEVEGRRGAIEGLVATAASLAIAESRDGGLRDATRSALKLVLARQDGEGAWSAWLQCRWPPFEVDTHYGPTLFAVAAGMSRDDPVWKESEARAGLAKLRLWLREHAPEGGHQQAMMLWASEHLPDLASRSQRQRWRRSLLELQRPDGGWSVHDLRHVAWPDAPPELQSDAYGTAFIAFVLLHTSADFEAEAVARALTWLRSRQRQSGHWYLPSPRRPGRRDYLSFAATGFAWMALNEAMTPGR